MSDSSQYMDGYTVIKRLLRYMGPYKFLLVISVFSMVITAATESGFAALMKPLTDISFVKQDDNLKSWLPMAMVGIFLLRGISAIISKYSLDYVTRNIIKQMREEMFSRTLHLPIRFFDKNSSGQLISKFIYDVEQVANAANLSAMIMVKDSLTIIGLLGWMLYISWELTTVLLIIIPVLALIISSVSRRFRKLSRRIQKSMGKVTDIAEESIAGQRVIKIYGGEDYELQHFVKENNYNRLQRMKLSLTTVLNNNILQMLVGSSFAVIVYFAIKQGITAGTFVSFIFAMMMLLPAIQNFTRMNATIQQGITAANSVFGLLDELPEHDQGTQVLQKTSGKIEYNIDNFAYEEAKGDVLKNIQLKIEPGQSIAFVGRSGSGKSTLVNLLPRFYELQNGTISIDGINVNDLTLASLRSQIAIVSQEVILFNDTIARNIAYGSLSTSNSAEIHAAAEAAHALEFIERLPDGFDTVVGESGTLLSGGQRQRLAIARALLKNAPILILDEATSALDTESERHIQAALETLMQNRTTLVIAHRLSTIEHVDKIVVMDNGRIVETGTHQELLDKQGRYAELHSLQFNN